jgi:hypothetical protein
MFFKPSIDPLIELKMRELDQTLDRLRAKLADYPAQPVGDEWPASESMAQFVRYRRMQPVAAHAVLRFDEINAAAFNRTLELVYSRYMILCLSDQEGADA